MGGIEEPQKPGGPIAIVALAWSFVIVGAAVLLLPVAPGWLLITLGAPPSQERAGVGQANGQIHRAIPGAPTRFESTRLAVPALAALLSGQRVARRAITGIYFCKGQPSSFSSHSGAASCSERI